MVEIFDAGIRSAGTVILIITRRIIPHRSPCRVVLVSGTHREGMSISPPLEGGMV